MRQNGTKHDADVSYRIVEQQALDGELAACHFALTRPPNSTLWL